MKKALVLAVACVIMLSQSSSAALIAETEGNGSTATANALVFTDQVAMATGTNASFGFDVDFYSFEAVSSLGYIFDVDSDITTDLSLYVFDSSGVLVAFGDDSTTDNDPLLGPVSLADGTHFVAITDFFNPADELLTNFALTFSDLPLGGVEVGGANPNAAFAANFAPTGNAGPYTLTVTAVPEPGTIGIWALLGVVGVLGVRRNTRR